MSLSPPPPPPPLLSAQTEERSAKGARRPWTPPKLDCSPFDRIGSFYPGGGCYEPGSPTDKTNSDDAATPMNC